MRHLQALALAAALALSSAAHVKTTRRGTELGDAASRRPSSHAASPTAPGPEREAALGAEHAHLNRQLAWIRSVEPGRGAGGAGAEGLADAREAMRFARAPGDGTEAEVEESYNKFARPMEHTPMVVLADIRVFNLYDIDEKSSRAHFDLLVELAWRDERLAYPPSELRGRPTKRVDPADIWRPQAVITNAYSIPKVIMEDATVAPDGTVRYVRRLDAPVVAPLNMRHFPFDEHTITIQLASFAYDAAQLLLTPAASSRDFDVSTVQHAVFVFSDWRVESAVERSLLSAQASHLSVSMTATRDPTGAMVVIVLPLAMIAMFAMAAGFVSLEHVDIRVSIAATAMLTVMAYLFVVSNELPRIAYLCWIHWYTIVVFLFVFLMLVQVVFLHFMDPDRRNARKEEEVELEHLSEDDLGDFWRASIGVMLRAENANSINTVARHILPGLFVLLVFFLFLVERPGQTLLWAAIVVAIGLLLALCVRYSRKTVSESDLLSVPPRTAAEAQRIADRAKEALASKRGKHTMRDLATVRLAQKHADELRRKEELAHTKMPFTPTLLVDDETKTAEDAALLGDVA